MKTDLIEQFRTLLADADADYAADLEDAEITGERPDLDDRQIELPVEWVREAADRIAALEAEASEGERRGLERAIEAIEGTSHVVNVEDDMQAWCDGYDFAEEAAVKAIRALIPGAPAQPELASAAANQLSGSRVGEPAREGNPEYGRVA